MKCEFCYCHLDKIHTYLSLFYGEKTYSTYFCNDCFKRAVENIIDEYNDEITRLYGCNCCNNFITIPCEDMYCFMQIINNPQNVKQFTFCKDCYDKLLGYYWEYDKEESE